MRPDMGKVTVERARTGSRQRSAKTGASVPWHGHDGNYDDQPRRGKVSSSWQYGYDSKSQTDVVGPLYGYLRKQVGRPWNKVYSEICKVMDRRNIAQDHVFNHIFDRVCRDPILHKDGVWRERDARWYSSPPELFVHPKTGLLQKNKRPKEAPKKKKLITEIELEGPSRYVYLGGIWYLAKVEIVPVEVWAKQWPNQRKYVIVHKRQLGKKELKALREKYKDLA